MHRFICIGKIKEKTLEQYATEFHKRLSRFLKLEICELKESSLQKETQQILPLLKGFLSIALTVEGVAMSSPAFSRFIFQERRQSLCFILGGSDGLSPEVLQQCFKEISLSCMTFPHDLARIIFLEQLYRAGTIFSGHPYHLKH